MLKNYFKIALRHISRNKSYLFINVIGMGLALACCIIAFVNYQYFEKSDSFFEKSDRIFRVTVDNVGSARTKADVVAPLVPRAVADISQVVEGTRIDKKSVIVQLNKQVFSENLSAVDPNFLEVFSYTVQEGNQKALQDPANIVITEETAKKYFGDTNPIGQVLSINPGQAWQKELMVGAVIQNPPPNSALQFDLLTHISFSETGPSADTLSHWDNTITASFLVLDDAQNTTEVVQQLKRYIPLENEQEKWREVTQYHLQPMGLVYKEGSELFNNSLRKLENQLIATAPGIMALLILLTACLNFTNTTISFSNKRLKEMGVRKVMGSNRRQLVVQLLGESFLICLLALFFGMLIAQFLIPYYNELWEMININLVIDYFSHPLLVAFLVGTLLLTTFLGGVYPAFYMTSFQTTQIFRGTTKFGGDSWLVRSLLGIQIVISLISIIGGITFAQNAIYQQELDLGYDTKSIINIPIDGEETYQKLKTVISSNPAILGIAGSRNNLGFWDWWTNFGKPEDNRSVQIQQVGEDFLEVMDIAIIEGRDFDKNRELDYEASAIINKKLLEEQQWESGIGKEIEMGGKKYTVIGVTENFIPTSLFEPQGPLVFTFNKPDSYRILKVKGNVEELIATNNYLKNTWASLFPYVPYEGYYQDEVLETSLLVSQSVSKQFIFLALIAMLLAATGLYSLVSLNLLKRAKEIAIRRVIGASTGNLAFLLNKHYLLIFLVGGVLGGIGGLYAAEFLLEQIFQTHQGVSIPATLLAVGFVCLIGAVTIGGKLFGVLRTNPAETLKSD